MCERNKGLFIPNLSAPCLCFSDNDTFNILDLTVQSANFSPQFCYQNTNVIKCSYTQPMNVLVCQKYFTTDIFKS